MTIKLVSIGYGNIVSASRIVSIISPESAPVKRLIQDARDMKKIIDATYGKRTRSVIITDSGHIILSALQPETVANKINNSLENIAAKSRKDTKDNKESKDNDDES